MRVKTIKKSKYKGVSLVKDRYFNEFWICRGEVHGIKFFSKHDHERDAAKQYDLVLMNRGIMPVNIYRQQL